MNNQMLTYHSSNDIMKVKQLATLRTLDYDVKEVKTGTEYHIRFLAGTQWTVLQIHLPSRFPKEKPKLILSPRIRHEWISDTGQILYAPMILNFSENSDLGKLVQSVIEELKKHCSIKPLKVNGPVFVQQTNYSSTVSFPASHATNHFIAPLPPFIPELESLSLEELRELNSSDSQIDEFVDSLPLAQTIAVDLEHQIDLLDKSARRNLHSKEEITDLRNKLLESYSELNKMKETWNTLSDEYHALSQRYVPNTIEVSLHEAATKAEEESEAIAEKFLSGEMDVESFISVYTASRTVSNARKTKGDILHKQLKELQRLGF